MTLLYWHFIIIIWLIYCLLLSIHNYMRIYYYIFFTISLVISIFLLILYNKAIIWYQILFRFYYVDTFQISYILGIDGLSIYFIILCVFLLMHCLLIYWFLKYEISLYSLLLSLSLWLLINIFTSLDMFFFYTFFEGIVIPMFLLIGIWGSRGRKVYAAYQFFLYTLLGSILVLFAFLNIYYSKGSSSFDLYLNSNFRIDKHLVFWILMFIGFAVKIPIVPLHIWLPEAHVEAPTPGSVILAGILLKLGSYAIVRLLIGSFHNIHFELIFPILTLAVLGFNYTSMVALNQIDIKKIIAYSSIAHMNFSLIGLFSYSYLGLAGMFYLMLGHSITSAALFIGIGALYDRYKTRLIFYYGALALFMPILATSYFIYILSNFGFPGTANFVGELLILAGILNFSNTILIISGFGTILGLIYSLFLYNRIFFGPLTETFIRYYCDCTRLEFFVTIQYIILVVAAGLYPGAVIETLQLTYWKLIINNVLENNILC